MHSLRFRIVSKEVCNKENENNLCSIKPVREREREMPTFHIIHVMASTCPSSFFIHLEANISHSLSDLSSLPDTMYLPGRKNIK